MRVFFFHPGEDVFGAVGGSIVDDNDFKLRIVLFQYGRKGGAQVFGIIVCTQDDRKRRQLLGEVHFFLAHGSVVQMNAVVQCQVIKELNNQQTGC
mgnify:CR=1 FL=1